MKIVGINTSPRKGSNSRIALVKALETAKSKGADTVIYDLNDMNIRTCQADNYCVDNNGKCILDDDLQDVYKSIDEAYGVILATLFIWVIYLLLLRYLLIDYIVYLELIIFVIKNFP